MSDANAADLGDMEVAYSEYANRIWGGRHFASCREFDRAIAKVKADARNETIDCVSRHYEDYLPAEWSWKVEKELRGKYE